MSEIAEKEGSAHEELTPETLEQHALMRENEKKQRELFWFTAFEARVREKITTSGIPLDSDTCQKNLEFWRAQFNDLGLLPNEELEKRLHVVQCNIVALMQIAPPEEVSAA